MAGTVLRIVVNADEAFWFDEVWTGTIAIHDWQGALDMIQGDIIAPLYYVTIWAWSKVFGHSNLSLRLPSMILTTAAPILAWLLLRSRTKQYELSLFTVLMALWIPGLYYSQEARSYSFVFFGAVMQTVFFFRAVHSKGARADIAVWALAGLFLGLTHYTTLVLSAVQGLSLVALFWRTRMVALVFAGLAFSPAFVAFYLQSSMIAQYVDYEHFWLKPLALRDLARAVTFVAGHKIFAPFLFAIFGIAAIIDILWLSRQRRKDGATRAGVIDLVVREWNARIRAGTESPFFLTGCVSVLGLGLFLIVAIFIPVFLPRYIIPFVPGLMMLVVWGVNAMPACHRWAIRSLVVLYFVGAAVWAGVSVAQVDKGLTWENESDILSRAGVTEVLFFLDQGFPIPYEDRVQSKVYSYYFDRNAVAARARAYYPNFATFEDPRGQLVRFLSEKPGRGVIWTLHPGPVPGPVPTDHEARKALIKKRGFSAVYDHTALHDIDGVTCHTTGPDSYRKMVCYSQAASTR